MPKPILLDGPMGTEIDRRGGNTSLPLWSARALYETPELIKEIHLDYIKAGADIITTNTFRTQPYTYEKAKIKDISHDLTIIAIEMAKEAAKGSKSRIAGSIAPVEECYSPHLTPPNPTLTRNFNQLISDLVNGGVDLLLIETMNSIREIEIAIGIAEKYDIPIWLSLTCDKKGTILSGESWESIYQRFSNRIEVAMVNCTSIEGTDNALEALTTYEFPNWGFYPNFGIVNEETGWTSGAVSEDFEILLNKWIKHEPYLIGTCCGATPATTSDLRKLIDSSF